MTQSDDSLTTRRALIGLLGAGAAVASTSPLRAAQAPASNSDARDNAATSIQSADWSAPLTEYIARSQSSAIPEATRELARRHMLDTLAAIIACRDLEASLVARRFVLEHSGGSSTAALLGTRERRATLDAVFASGMTAHAAEINDFCPSAFTQPGASIVPATLCVADARNLSGEALLRAMIVGYEIACRMPKSLGIRNLRMAALANHSVGPIFGCAAGVASLIRLPPAQLVHMLSYCVQQASGNWQWLRDVEHIEKAFVFGGMPARRGTEAALFAEAGFTGVGDPFRGEPGWLNSSLFKGPQSDFDAAYLTTDLGKRWELPLVAYKRYPVGGPAQPAIELLLEFLKELPARRIRQVRIDMPGRAAAFAAAEMPALNLPYLCSIILADGRLDFVAAQSRQRFLNDAAIRAFMPNVSVLHDPEQEAEPRVESARVTLTLDDGSQREKFLDHVKGFPAHPFERDDVERKALELMEPHLGKARARELVATLWQLESLASVRPLVRMMAR